MWCMQLSRTSGLNISRRCARTASWDSKGNGSVVAMLERGVGSRARSDIWRVLDGGEKERCFAGLNSAVPAWLGAADSCWFCGLLGSMPTWGVSSATGGAILIE